MLTANGRGFAWYSQVMNEEPMNCIDQLEWLLGPWRGTFGQQQVREAWRRQDNRSIDTVVHLIGPEGVDMIEMIVIRESSQHQATKLVLHLRQFTPQLELVTTQNMVMTQQADNAVVFTADPGAGISQLGYRLDDSGQLVVNVGVATGEVLTAQLQRD